MSDCTCCPQTFPHLSAAISEVGRMTEWWRLYAGSHLSAPEKPDLHWFPTQGAHQLSGLTRAAPGNTLTAKVRMKGDTVICVITEGTQAPQQTVETCLTAEGDQIRTLNNPMCIDAAQLIRA